MSQRLRWLMPLFLLSVAVLGGSGLIDLNLQPPPRPKPMPVFPATDGLPEALVGGQRYPTTFQIHFPADWPREEGADNPEVTGASMVVSGRGKGERKAEEPEPFGGMEVEVIFCSAGEVFAAGRTVTFDCSILAPSPGPFTLHLTAGARDGGVFFGNDNGQGIAVTKDYQHTVQPPEHP
jgi:hypothetical protein